MLCIYICILTEVERELYRNTNPLYHHLPHHVLLHLPTRLPGEPDYFDHKTRNHPVSDLELARSPDDPQRIRVASVFEFSVCLIVCLFSVCSLQIFSFLHFTPPGVTSERRTVQYSTVQYSTVQYILERANKGRLPLVLYCIVM